MAVAVVTFMPPLGPMAAADASITSPTQPGISPRSHSTGNRFADLTVGMGTEGVVAMHNELLGTDPPYDARLATGPTRVTLTFDLPAQRGFSTIIVTGPDGNQWQAGPATENGTQVSAPVRPLGPAGKYTVAWRIVSADGHPVHATFPFTLTTPGTGTAAAPSPTAGHSASGPPMWLWLAGAGALLVAGMAMALWTRRRRG
jgi:copper resistance protein C